MKAVYPRQIEASRLDGGPYATKPGEPRGAFRVRCPLTSTWLTILVGPASDWIKDGLPPPAWDHVSVSTVQRCPTWEEMCWVKEQFFAPEECVVQYHPPRSRYVNQHPNCLHLWRLAEGVLPMPPTECV